MSIIQAHINQGENKTVITIEYVKNHKEKIAKQILTALSLKKVWEIVKTLLRLTFLFQAMAKQDQKDLLNLPLYRAMYFYIVMCSL